MKIEYYTNRNAPLWFWMGVGLYLFLTLCGIIGDFFIETDFIIPIAWGLLGGYAVFYYALKPYRISLSEKEIEYKTLCGMVKTFPVQGISFTEKMEYNKYSANKWMLCLYFPQYKFKVYRDNNPQYAEILEYCQQHLHKKYDERRDTRYLIPFYFFAIIIIAHFGYIYYCKKQKLEGEVKITATYDSHELIPRGRWKRWYKLEIKLKEYPEIEFGTWKIKSEDEPKVDSIFRSKPHTFVFTISRDDYEKKIKKSLPMEFCDKYMDRNFVDVLDKLENIENKEGQKIFVEIQNNQP